MHEEMQLINSLVYMPMTEIPCLIVQHLLDGIQPMLGAVTTVDWSIPGRKHSVGTYLYGQVCENTTSI